MWQVVVTLWLGVQIHIYALPTVFASEPECLDHARYFLTHWRMTAPKNNDAMFECRKAAIKI